MNYISKTEIFWQNHLNWFIPFVSELYPLTKFQLLQHEDLWDWDRVQRNPFIKWDKNTSSYFSDNLSSLVKFPTKEITIGLKNPEYYFQFFSELPAITNENVYLREEDEDDELHDIKIYWKDILFGNYEIPTINEKSVILLIEKFDCGIELTGELDKDMPIPPKFIEKNKNVLNWKELSGYCGLRWSFELLQQFQDYWVTEQLICNHTAFNYCLKDDLDDESIEKVLKD